MIACTADPGDWIVPGRSPLLPAAATTILPLFSTAASTACESPSSPSDGTSDPRLKEITSTLGRSAHHWIPRTPSESSPLPVESRTLAADSSASGATPCIRPAIGPGPTPSPAAIEATWVPCPMSSYAVVLWLIRSKNGMGAFESSCSWPGAPARRTKVAPKSPVKSIASATRKMSIARRWLAMAGAVRTDFSTGPGSDGMAADMGFNGRE